MKLPCNLTGLQLVKQLKQLGYQITRDSPTLQNGEHHITILAHNPLKTGILSAILNDVALIRDELLNRLL